MPSRSMTADTAKCLVDYGRRAKASGNEQEWLDLLAGYAGVDPTTVLYWVHGERLPMGETLLKVRCFLWGASYHVTELKTLPQVTRKLAMIIASGILTLDEVVRELDYKDRGAVLAIILRDRRPMQDKFFRIERIVARHDETLRGAIGYMGDRFAVLFNAERVTSEDSPGDGELSSVTSVVPDDSLVERAAHEPSVAIPGADRAVVHLITALYELMRGTSDPYRLTDYVRANVPEDVRQGLRNLLNSTL